MNGQRLLLVHVRNYKRFRFGTWEQVRSHVRKPPSRKDWTAR